VSVSFDRAEQINWTIAGGVLATSAVLASAPFTASLAVGVALEAVNYRALRRSAQLFFAGELQGGRAWGAAFGLRFALLAVAMTVAIGAGAHPVGLAIGLSTMVPALLIAAARQRPDASIAPAPGLAPDDPGWEDWNAWTASERRRSDEDEEQ
jgi:hypothetical protein